MGSDLYIALSRIQWNYMRILMKFNRVKWVPCLQGLQQHDTADGKNAFKYWWQLWKPYKRYTPGMAKRNKIIMNWDMNYKQTKIKLPRWLMKHHAIRHMTEGWYSSVHSSPRHWVHVRQQFHARTFSTPGKEDLSRLLSRGLGCLRTGMRIFDGNETTISLLPNLLPSY